MPYRERPGYWDEYDRHNGLWDDRTPRRFSYGDYPPPRRAYEARTYDYDGERPDARRLSDDPAADYPYVAEGDYAGDLRTRDARHERAPYHDRDAERARHRRSWMSGWFGDSRIRDDRRAERHERQRREDNRLRSEIAQRLDNDRRIDPRMIEVSVDDGDVTLHGSVFQRYERRIAEDIADDVPGVRHVRSDLRVHEPKWR